MSCLSCLLASLLRPDPLDVGSAIFLYDSHPMPKEIQTGDPEIHNLSDLSASTYPSSVRVVDLSMLMKQSASDNTDKLPSSLYETVHRRQERAEKSIRNIEKNRAQHEKGKVEQLLEGLQGGDWLKVLGVHGVMTEARRKQYKDARDYFIMGCSNILRKFEMWAKQEKKMKEKSRSHSGLHSKSPEHASRVPSGKRAKDGSGSDGIRKVKKPRRSQIGDRDDTQSDDEAGEQLEEEAVGSRIKKPRLVLKSSSSHLRQENTEQEEQKPHEFTSFFAKKWQSDAAIQGRRTRHPLAFGRPLPEPKEKEFDLPTDLLDAETMRSRARRRRAARRQKSDVGVCSS